LEKIIDKHSRTLRDSGPDRNGKPGTLESEDLKWKAGVATN